MRDILDLAGQVVGIAFAEEERRAIAGELRAMTAAQQADVLSGSLADMLPWYVERRLAHHTPAARLRVLLTLFCFLAEPPTE